MHTHWPPTHPPLPLSVDTQRVAAQQAAEDQDSGVVQARTKRLTAATKGPSLTAGLLESCYPPLTNIPLLAREEAGAPERPIRPSHRVPSQGWRAPRVKARTRRRWPTKMTPLPTWFLGPWVRRLGRLLHLAVGSRVSAAGVITSSSVRLLGVEPWIMPWMGLGLVARG